MDASPISRRAAAFHDLHSFTVIRDFLWNSPYTERRTDPGIADFTFGNPHDMPMPEYVDALRAAANPQDPDWFGYKDYVPAAQEAAAASLERLLRIPFAPEDILLTTGGFAAIATALKTAADPGDEVIYSLPPWFLYEGLCAEAGLTPVKVMIDLTTFDLDVDAIAAAITPRTRVVIINTPNNPTGRIYPPETLRRLAAVLEEASVRYGRRISLISDEPYNRIVFDGARFHSPAEFYPYTFIAYSYGKTHLAPGQRIGYIALPPTMPDREAVRAAIMQLQIVAGWAFPNAIMQYALPRLEQFMIDVERLQRRRDRIVEALTEMGYPIHRPEGTFYLWPRSPIGDDAAFARELAEHDIFVLPGHMFETPGFFRICLTANDEMIERSLPGFAAAITRVRAEQPAFIST
ncbi:MAG TPA: aminotransferase class I/II-fold pyridoxal phosphate-dependent enzyme [Thermomicrobiales bacterium]|nr:aminotransferase class I/II-fold pyridoxal phosphate-dependent enzyme [Thermomicrobiales bacterium]